MMGKKQQPSVQKQEELIFSQAEDLNRAFIQLYTLYAAGVYRYCYVALYHHEKLAEQVTADVFKKAFKYFHSFEPGAVTYRSYIFALAVQQVVQKRVDLKTDQNDRIRLSRRFSAGQRKGYHWLQVLDPITLTIFELWHGEGLTAKDIALAVRFDESEVLRRHTETRQGMLHVNELDATETEALFTKLHNGIKFSSTRENRIIDAVLKSKRRTPTFVRRQWWSAIVGPVPFTFAAGTVLAVLAMLWYVQRPAPVVVEEQVVQVEEAFITPSVQQRPVHVITQGGLPEVITTSLSLTAVDENLFGTDYVVKRDTEEAAAEELRPNITVNLPVKEFKPIESAYAYSTPEALSEEDLQRQAFANFSSLPLNQFTYVNGTYYIEEAEGQFRPLFIAFNVDGSIEFQMRQAAICDLEQLTDDFAEDDVKTFALEFMRSHSFVTVDDEDLVVELVSNPEQTTTRDAFCNDGDTTPVQDREFVIYSPHTLIRFDESAQDLLPMRFKGMAVQVHGNTVTNVRIDPLYSLQDNIVRTEELPLLPLDEAVNLLTDFYYPSADSIAEYQRFQRVFVQWDHQYGNSRLQDITISDVRLEYVFDDLNKSIEPYYVFSGTGIDAVADDSDIRMYVSANVNDVELRGPYRE